MELKLILKESKQTLNSGFVVSSSGKAFFLSKEPPVTLIPIDEPYEIKTKDAEGDPISTNPVATTTPNQG